MGLQNSKCLFCFKDVDNSEVRQCQCIENVSNPVLGGCGLISLAQGHDLVADNHSCSIGNRAAACLPPIEGVKDG